MPVSEKAGSKRDEILEVASRLFYEQGYNQTGIQQIIKEAGSAKGTFYSHFESKEDLGVAWLKRRHETWMGWLNEALKGKRTARTRLLGVFEFLGTWMAGCGYRGCAFLNTMCETPDCESPLREQIVSHKRDLLALIRGLVGENEPELSAGLVEQKARQLFVLFEGALVGMQNFRESWPLEAAMSQVKELV